MPRVRRMTDNDSWNPAHLAAYRVEVQGRTQRDLIRLRDEDAGLTYEMNYSQANELGRTISALLYELREKRRRREERIAAAAEAMPAMRNDHDRDEVRELPTIDTEACDRLSRNQEETEPLREGIQPEVAGPQREGPEAPAVL